MPAPGPGSTPSASEAEEAIGGLQRYVLTGTAANYAGQLVTLTVWFFLTPFILHRVGVTQYALWVLVASILAYGRLFDLGIADAVIKYTAEHRAKGDDRAASELIATALWLYIAIGIVISIAVYFLAPSIVGVFNVPPGEQDTARALVRVTAVAVAVELPAATAFAVLQGLHRFDLSNLIGSIAMLGLAAATVTVLLLGGGVVALAAVTIPMTLLWQVPAVIAIHRIAPGMRFGLRGAQRRHVRAVASFSGALVGISLADTIKTKSSEIVIGAALPVAAVAPFSLARRLSELPEMLTYQFAKVLMPLSSHLHAGGEAQLLRGIFVTATRVTIGMFCAIAVPMALLADRLLAAWVGDVYAKDADVLVILIFAGLAKATMFPTLLMLQGMDRHRPLMFFALGSAALNLVLAISLVGPLGVTGVAWATLIATGLEVLVAVPFALHVNGVSPWAFVGAAVVPSLVAAVPAVATTLLLVHVADPTALWSLGLSAGFSVLVFAAAFLAMPQARQELDLVRGVPGWIARARG